MKRVLGEIGFVIVALLICPASPQRWRGSLQGQDTSCEYGDRTYVLGQKFALNSQQKLFLCECKVGRRLHCEWSPTHSQSNKCHDSASRTLKHPGETWERIRDGKIFDCLCIRGPSGMQVTCSDEKRCHYEGVSYKQGTQFQTTSPSGRIMNCRCLEKKRVSCRYEENLPAPERNTQRIEHHVVRGGERLYPQITTLQACRTGSKVVTSGVVWNQTNTNAMGVKTLEQCTCSDAIVRCRTLHVLDRVEPHCVSIDGQSRAVGKRWLRTQQRSNQEYICECYAHKRSRCRRTRVPHCIDDVAGEIHAAGDTWERVHETLANLVFQCTCNENKRITCRDIGECSEPPAPVNGALLCANVGRAGQEQLVYCKPMCLSDYEFVNPQRYFRIWEVCGPMNLHRWSGGFIGDPDAIARCRGYGLGLGNSIYPYPQIYKSLPRIPASVMLQLTNEFLDE